MEAPEANRWLLPLLLAVLGLIGLSWPINRGQNAVR
jgi:hypothetical protein